MSRQFFCKSQKRVCVHLVILLRKNNVCLLLWYPIQYPWYFEKRILSLSTMGGRVTCLAYFTLHTNIKGNWNSDTVRNNSQLKNDELIQKFDNLDCIRWVTWILNMKHPAKTYIEPVFSSKKAANTQYCPSLLIQTRFIFLWWICFDSIDGAVPASSLSMSVSSTDITQAAGWDSTIQCAIYEIKTNWA